MSSSSSSAGTNSSNSSSSASNLDPNAAVAAAAALLDTKPLIQSVSHSLSLQQSPLQSQHQHQNKQGQQVVHFQQEQQQVSLSPLKHLTVLKTATRSDCLAIKPEPESEQKPELAKMTTVEWPIKVEVPQVAAKATPYAVGGEVPPPPGTRKMRNRIKAVDYGSATVTMVSNFKASPEVPATRTVHRTTLRSLASAAAATAAGLLAPSPSVSVLNESKLLQRRVSGRTVCPPCLCPVERSSSSSSSLCDVLCALSL